MVLPRSADQEEQHHPAGMSTIDHEFRPTPEAGVPGWAAVSAWDCRGRGCGPGGAAPRPASEPSVTRCLGAGLP
jgi:hypothetical protein